MSETKPFVAVLMGSDSDFQMMQHTLEALDRLGIPYEMKVTSAHRTPDATHAYVKQADARGCSVFIAAAGLAAHLAGTIAGLTIKPVIGVPMEGGSLGGMDALLSTVQMPAGIPVACVAIGQAGAKNAAYLAAQIMGLSSSKISALLQEDRAENARVIREKDLELNSLHRSKN